MKHCSSCGAELTDDAKFCGSCGATAAGSPSPPDKPERSTGKKVGIAIVGLLVLFFILGECVGPVDNSKQISDKGKVVTIPPISVTVNELFAAYQANEARAQQQYGGKPLRVSGTLDKVDLDYSDTPELLLKTSNQFMSSRANLVEADQPKAKDLNAGQPIVLLCQDVSEVMSIPLLKACSIVQ